MTNSIKQLVSKFNKYKIDSLLVTCDTNIRYLVGFPSAESWLFITPAKIFFITDFRYYREAKDALSGVSVKCSLNSKTETLFEIAKKMKVNVIGVDENVLLVSQYRNLASNKPKIIKLKKATGLIESLRIIKEAGEIQRIKEALKIQKKAVAFLHKVVKPGVSEKEVFFKLEKYVREMGVRFSFDPIIASGHNSSYPHARITDRKIQKNDIVLIDFGIDVKGYKSDLTRMFFLGKISHFIQEVVVSVVEAQRRAIEIIKPGIAAFEIDKQARNYLAKKKLAKYFRHSLGHGVGLDIHEAPMLSRKDSSILEEGMIVTVEPAVYIPGKFGIRIEDMVLVTKKGCKVLSDNIN